MISVFVAAGIQFASILLLGLPLAIIFFEKKTAEQSLGWFLLAPALGATIYFSAGTVLHSFGLHSVSVFWGLIGLSAIWLMLLFCLTRRVPFRFMLAGIGLCFVGAVSGLAVNSADLTFAGLDYFPLTNDDTFSYLGHIDQIRSTGWIAPRILYPAGFFPLIDHAVFTRTPSVIFAADFSDILGLETHSAFFLSQRLALPIIALGATAVVMLVTSSFTAATLCFATLIFGNVLLHQILQQFNSSTMGTVIGPIIIAATLWTFRFERSENEMMAGSALTGWACGAMAITSMEAHPFYLIAFGSVAIIAMLSARSWTRAGKAAAAFLALYLSSSFPLLLKVWPALISQFVNAANGHPGDWIAATGFFMQATGVTLTTADKLTAYPLIPRVTAMTVLASVIVSILVLAWNTGDVDKRTKILKSDLVGLVSVAILLLSFQMLLYAHGSGYGLLKVTDYFAFFGAIVVSVAAFQLGLTESKLVDIALLSMFAGYCAIAFVEKQHILALYRDRTVLMPLPSAYELDQGPARTTVYADLSAESLNLFLYKNRYGTTTIIFGASESNRFKPRGEPGSTAQAEIARMFRVGAMGTTVADITYTADSTPPLLKFAALAGQTHLIQPDPHWLPPAGSNVGSLWRWLSQSGKFLIYGPLLDGQRTLEVDLAAGPDLHPDNRIELYISGQRVRTISPSELPLRVDAILPALSKLENEGDIRIVGPVAGVHQLSVARLLSVPR